MKKEYVSISVRVPKEVHDTMAKLRDLLELTTNQIVSHAIEDWTEMATTKSLNITKRLEIARFALELSNRKE